MKKFFLDKKKQDSGNLNNNSIDIDSMRNGGYGHKLKNSSDNSLNIDSMKNSGYILKSSNNTKVENKQNEEYKPKWYFSYPVLIISLWLCFPISFILSLLRIYKFKEQKKGYRIRSFLALGVNLMLILMVGYFSVMSEKWKYDYDKSIESGDYNQAKYILDEHYKDSISQQGVERYLKIFELSDDYSEVDGIILSYKNGLADISDFDEGIIQEIELVSDKLNAEQKTVINEIEEDVRKAKIKKAEEESKAIAESESRKAEEESKAIAESESKKAAEESRVIAESESKKAEEESRAIAESISKAEKESRAIAESESRQAEEESREAAKESKAIAESESKKAEEESKAIAESESRKAEEESKAIAESESKKAAEWEVAEKKAEETKEIRRIISEYVEEPKKKYLKELEKKDESLVWEILKECIKESVEENKQYRLLSESEIKKYCEIYQKSYSKSNDDIDNILKNIQMINDLETTENNVKKKYGFELSDGVMSVESRVWYVRKRLENHYEDTISGAIRKEIDSYTRTNTSQWLAYNVEYYWGEAMPGDNAVVLCSGEKNPFSHEGAYTMDCILLPKTTTLVDPNGFQWEADVYEIVPDTNVLYNDYNRVLELQYQVEELWNQIGNI